MSLEFGPFAGLAVLLCRKLCRKLCRTNHSWRLDIFLPRAARTMEGREPKKSESRQERRSAGLRPGAVRYGQLPMTCRRPALRLSRYFLRRNVTMRSPKIPRRERNRIFGTGPEVATSIFESEGAIDVPPLQGLRRAWPPGPALALLAPAQAVIGRAFSPPESAPSLSEAGRNGKPHSRFSLQQCPTSSAGQDARLYGRRDACRYAKLIPLPPL